MNTPMGFGILGAGLVAPFHAKAIRGSQGGRLVAVCDTNVERANKMAAEYQVKAYTVLADMLKDDEIHAVNVCLPNHLHTDAVLACAAAGKHVLTEKPPAMSLRETDAMIAACRSANVKFGCTVQCRVRQAIQAIRKALGDGRFGRLLQADTYMKWFRPETYYHSDAWRQSRRSGAGVTIQHAFHYIDLLQYLAGPVVRVHAKMRNLAHPSVALEDTLLAFLEYANGAQGVVEASTGMWPGTDIRIEVHGERGTVLTSGERIVTWKFQDEQPGDDAVRKIGNAAQATGAGGAADFGYLDHQVVIQDLIDAVREDREVVIPVVTVRHTLEICLAMYQSAARGGPVDLPVQDDDRAWEWKG